MVRMCPDLPLLAHEGEFFLGRAAAGSRDPSRLSLHSSDHHVSSAAQGQDQVGITTQLRRRKLQSLWNNNGIFRPRQIPENGDGLQDVLCETWTTSAQSDKPLTTPSDVYRPHVTKQLWGHRPCHKAVLQPPRICGRSSGQASGCKFVAWVPDSLCPLAVLFRIELVLGL